MDRLVDILEGVFSIVVGICLFSLLLGAIFVWRDWILVAVFAVCNILWVVALVMSYRSWKNGIRSLL